MRLWLFLPVLTLLLAVPSLSSAEPWGCCIPPVGECFSWADGQFNSAQELANACDAASTAAYTAILRDPGVAETCNPYGECTIGCCCAGAAVPDRYTINNNEEQLAITFAACSFKSGFEPNLLPPGSTCVDVCGGTAEPPENGPPGTYTVSGTVKNASSGSPLANADVFISYTGGEIANVTDAGGEFTLRGVPEMTTRLIAVHASCTPGLSDPVNINQDKTGVTISLTCGALGCTHAAPVVTSVTAVRGTADVDVTASFTDTCFDRKNFELYQCGPNFAGCGLVGQSTEPTLTASGLAPNTTYCFKVGARFDDDTLALSGSASGACITTGDVQCMQEHEDTLWCGVIGSQESILSCDEHNKLITELCDAGQLCSARSGTPECIAPPACDQCNGLVGLFARLLDDLEIDSYPFIDTCSNACMLDSERAGNPTLVDTYSSCSGIADCTQLRSQAACEGAELCDVDGCSWTVLSEELGQGLCVGVDTPSQCEQCDDLFGSCSRTMCEAISDSCYYDTLGNGLSSQLVPVPRCISKENTACRYYDSKEDCVGSGPNAVFNIEYDDDLNRIGGDNARTVSSQDALGLGVCSWSDATGICFKDADMLESTNDDCIISGRFFTDPTCVEDLTPPVTEFFLANTAYSRVAVRTLPFRVTDDRSPADLLKTFVCFDSSATPCAYPTQEIGNVALPQAGTYDMLYYSRDANGNSEVVRTLPIQIVDTGEIAIEDVAIVEEEAST